MITKDNRLFVKLFISKFLSFLLILSASSAYAGYEEPWEAPDKNIPQHQNNLADDGNLLKQSLTLAVRFFQKVISPVDGDKCPMYPTCSEYSVQALKKHGAILGFIMTADRLIHEADEQKHAKVIIKYGTPRFLDTLEDNDFWWYKNENK